MKAISIQDKINLVAAKQRFMQVAIISITGEKAAQFHESVYLGADRIMGEIGDDLDEIVRDLERI